MGTAAFGCPAMAKPSGPPGAIFGAAHLRVIRRKTESYGIAAIDQLRIYAPLFGRELREIVDAKSFFERCN